jgi:hypothetical protein
MNETKTQYKSLVSGFYMLRFCLVDISFNGNFNENESHIYSLCFCLVLWEGVCVATKLGFTTRVRGGGGTCWVFAWQEASAS